MNCISNIEGFRIGDWTIGQYLGKRKNGHYWLCKCKCGNQREVIHNGLIRGKTLSCGCGQIRAATKHGLSRSAEYRCWRAMKNRCHNPNVKAYPLYGGRGIKVCDRWMKFENFYKDMGSSNGLTIERINVNGNYEPNNCKWITLGEQAQNRTNTIRLTLNGETKTLNEWAISTKIKLNTIKARLAKKWTVESVLTQPLHPRS